MKKILLFVLTITCLLNGFSQKLSKSEGNIKSGLRLGLVGSQISGDDLAGYHKLGAYAGLFANIPLSQSHKWHFQMELNFIMKGSSTQLIANADGTLPNYYVLTMLYTETPFLFQYNFGFYKSLKGNVYDFDFEFGPTLNFLFYSHERNQFNDIRRLSEDQQFNIFDIGIIVGLKCSISDKWDASFRYGTSVYPVRIPTMVYNRLVKKQFNDHIAFSLCYHFN